MAIAKIQPISELDQRQPREGDIVRLKTTSRSSSFGVVGAKVAGGLYEIKIMDTRQVAVVRADQMVLLGAVEELVNLLKSEQGW